VGIATPIAQEPADEPRRIRVRLSNDLGLFSELIDDVRGLNKVSALFQPIIFRL